MADSRRLEGISSESESENDDDDDEDDEKTKAVKETLLREAARHIVWEVGQVIYIDTEDGFEEGATIIGPSTEGDETQMSVRFADGSVDNWDVEDFVTVTENAKMAEKQTKPPPSSESDPDLEHVSDTTESEEEGEDRLNPNMTVEEALASEDTKVVEEVLLREAARLIEWETGQVIDIDTEDGYEKGVTILGPSTEGDETQMYVRFADGSVDNWDIEDFVALATEQSKGAEDPFATGKTAAIALQRELVQHGTKDVKKIDRLRRASMQPDDAGAAMAAAAAAAAMAEDETAATISEGEEEAEAGAEPSQLVQDQILSAQLLSAPDSVPAPRNTYQCHPFTPDFRSVADTCVVWSRSTRTRQRSKQQRRRLSLPGSRSLKQAAKAKRPRGHGS